MNFSLEHFELHFSNEFLPAGEQLYETDAIQHFEEVDKNLWSYEIKETETYEVEILISPTKVISYSCDCDTFKEKKECKHIISSLYHLRMLKTEKVVQKPSISVRSYPKKLSIPHILKEVSSDDLKNFVRSYSKKNKHFATALKANFARKIELEDNEEKYESILNSIIRPATGKDYRISFSAIKALLRVADQFDGQFEDALSLKQYKEAFFIVKSILSKTAYTNHWTNSEREDVLEIFRHFHKQYDLFFDLDIPPSLKSDLIQFGKDLVQRSYYHVTHPELNLFTIFLYRDLIKKSDNFYQVLHEKLNSNQLHEKEAEFLWMVRQNYVQYKKPVLAEKEAMLGSQAVYRITDYLIEKKYFLGAIDLLNLFKDKGRIKDHYLAKKYLQVLVNVKDKEHCISEAIAYMAAYRDLYFYSFINESFPKNAEEIFKTVSKLLRSKTTLTQETLYLEILIYENKVEEVIDFLLSSRHPLQHLYISLEFLDNEGHKIIPLIEKILTKYLGEILGRESANEMRKFLLFLRNKGLDKAFSKSKKFLSENYAERKWLIEEIKDLRL